MTDHEDDDPEEIKLLVAQWLEKNPLPKDVQEAIEEYEANPPPLVEQVAENMAIYAGVTDDSQFLPMAKWWIDAFTTVTGRPPRDYLELEEWAMKHLPPQAQ
jgi:hypothetical protein